MLVLVLDELDRLLQGRGGLEELVRLFMMPHAQGGWGRQQEGYTHVG